MRRSESAQFSQVPCLVFVILHAETRQPKTSQKQFRNHVSIPNCIMLFAIFVGLVGHTSDAQGTLKRIQTRAKRGGGCCIVDDGKMVRKLTARPRRCPKQRLLALIGKLSKLESARHLCAISQCVQSKTTTLAHIDQVGILTGHSQNGFKV